MLKKIPLTVCLLTTVLFAGTPLVALAQSSRPTTPGTTRPTTPGTSTTPGTTRPTTPGTSTTPGTTRPTTPGTSTTPGTTRPTTPGTTRPVPPAQTGASPLVSLSIADLPSGFEVIPADVKSQIVTQLQVLAQQFGGQLAVKPENLFAYWNPEKFQVIAGFSDQIPNAGDRAKLDAALKDLQKPENLAKILTAFRQKAPKEASMVKVIESKPITTLNNVADASAGVALTLEIQEQAMKADVAAFRRKEVGVTAVVLYLGDEKPLMDIGAIARKLDTRVPSSTNPSVQSPTSPNRSTGTGRR